MGTKSIKYRRARRRTRLYQQSPYCPYCHVKMVLPEHIRKQQGINRITKPPHNMCTIEHVFTKINPLRQQKHQRPTTTICCFACNQRRGAIENRLKQQRQNFLRNLNQIDHILSPNPIEAKVISIGSGIRGILALYLFLLATVVGFSQTPFYIMKPVFVEDADTTFIIQGASLKNTWLNSKLTFAVSDDGLLKDNIIFSAKVLYVPLHGDKYAFPIVLSGAPGNKNLFVPESGLNIGIYPYKILNESDNSIMVIHGGIGYKMLPKEIPEETLNEQIKIMFGVEWLIYQKGFKAPATISLTQNLWRNSRENIFGAEITGIIPIGVDMGILMEYYQPYSGKGGIRAGIIVNSIKL